jgi:hypothetical protein
MLAAMVATAILVAPIGIALIPAPSDSYPRSAGFPRVGQPVVPQELEQSVKRQASARRAAELSKLLTLAESPVSITAGSSSAVSDTLDGRPSPQVNTPKAQSEDAADRGTSVRAASLASQQFPACTDVQRAVTALEAKNANAQPETHAIAAAEVEPVIEPATVTPRAKPGQGHLHARHRIRLTRGTTGSSDAPPPAGQSNPDRNTSVNTSRRTLSTSAFPVIPPTSTGSRGSAF